MQIRARAPLRLGLAGGGTDLSPYCEEFGGAVLNATIDLYAYATLEPLSGDRVYFVAKDAGFEESDSAVPDDITIGGKAILHRAVYKAITRRFLGGKAYPCRLTTFCEAPPGSGLGSSSTMVVALVKAFVEALALPMGEYDIARLAFEIERVDAGLQGGRQDQYAATFGGFNFMEFHAQDRVTLKGDFRAFASVLNRSWQAKKQTAASISNPRIEHLMETAMGAGAVAGKVSGAGGGGFTPSSSTCSRAWT